jgi:hypothetical protein
LTVEKEDYTLLALAIRGGGYEAEWASNVTLGTSGQHQGFHKASQDVLRFLENYIKTHDIKGKIKLWLTGYSRGAATANLLAGELNSGRKLPQVELASSDLYAFCFESPAGTLASFNPRNKKNDNIINIVNPNDVVTKWRLKRKILNLLGMVKIFNYRPKNLWEKRNTLCYATGC